MCIQYANADVHLAQVALSYLDSENNLKDEICMELQVAITNANRNAKVSDGNQALLFFVGPRVQAEAACLKLKASIDVLRLSTDLHFKHSLDFPEVCLFDFLLFLPE